jgi:hypothetical protein
VSIRFAQWHSKVSRALFWNAFLRLILEATLDFVISSLINIDILLKLMKEGVNDWWQPSLPFFWFNYLTVTFAVVVTIAGPIFVLVYYCCKFRHWKKNSFEQRMGAVLDGLRKNTRVAIFYPVFFMIRRLIFGI